MSEQQPNPPAVDRRFLLRGGAVLAGAAGATVIGAALGPATAQAADDNAVLVGNPNTGTRTTGLEITGPNSDPTLTLTNAAGPSLHLTPVAFGGELVPGDFVATDQGPEVGVDYNGPETTIVATGKDLDFLPLATPTKQTRLLDTRSATSRAKGIVRKSSASAIDSQGRLTANSYIDVAVASSDGELIFSAAFLNVAVLNPTAWGYLTVYPPGDRPGVSTINFSTGVNLSNAAFVGLEETVENNYVVRIHTSKTTHVLLDISGAVLGFSPYGAEGAKTKKATGRRAARQDKRAVALRKSLSAR